MPADTASAALIIEDIPGVREFVAESRRGGRSVGVVPTMGALHAGHFAGASIFFSPPIRPEGVMALLRRELPMKPRLRRVS